MKLLLIFTLSIFPFITHAENDAKFPEHKKMMVDAITKQIENLQKAKSCIEAATDHEGVKKCHETAKAERTKIQAARIDENIKKLEEKKKDLEGHK
jgi:hypothetical protein